MYFTPSAVKRQNFLRREKRLPPPAPPLPPPPRRSSPQPIGPPRSPPRPPPPSLLKAIAVYLRALRRLLRPGCRHRRREQQLPHAGGASEDHHSHHPHHSANARGDVHLPLRQPPSPSARARSRLRPY